MVNVLELADELGTDLYSLSEFAAGIVPATPNGVDVITDAEAEMIRESWKEHQ